MAWLPRAKRLDFRGGMSATGGPSTSFRGALGATLKKPAEKEVQAAPLPQVVKVVSPAKVTPPAHFGMQGTTAGSLRSRPVTVLRRGRKMPSQRSHVTVHRTFFRLCCKLWFIARMQDAADSTLHTEPSTLNP